MGLVDMSYEELKGRWPWRPIHGCPGRFLLSPDTFSGPPEQLLADAGPSFEARSEFAADPVHVIRMSEGGLISYRKADGRFVHTLNTEEGLERKLAQLAIDPPGGRDR
jgi:hypothetical protein